MPSSETVARQRAWGGALGVAVLAGALSFHFFPHWFHVDSGQAPRRSMSLGSAPARSPPSLSAAATVTQASSEVDAGPPLTMAPTAVIAARQSRTEKALPVQTQADPPQVQALLARADKALAAGQVAGDTNSAAALYLAAIKLKADSRRANQGLIDVRSRLVAAIGQDITVGDADSADDLLDTLRELPGSRPDVAALQLSLNTLNRVRPMLAQAAALLGEGKADRPAGDNAFAVYRQVLAIDPENAVAHQGLLQVQRAILDRALAGVAQNDFPAAARALDQAAVIVPDSPQMKDVRSRVQTMRQQRASGLLAQARSALDAGNAKLAQQLAAQAKAIGGDKLAGLGEFDQRLVNARLYASFSPGQEFSDGYVDMPGKAPAMVVVPTGSFLMGSPAGEPGHQDNETPPHWVSIGKGMAVARGEITVAQFRDFVRRSGYKPESITRGGASVYEERTGALREESSATWEDDYAGRPAGDSLPVVNVSWNDASAYARWLSQHTGKRYRLLSEAEFEYAERAKTTTAYWWGTGKPPRAVENLTGSNDRSVRGRRWSNAFRGYRDGYWGPAPVASFSPNAFGLYDMSGNVSEWTQDCWHDSYLRAPRDGSAWVNPGCNARVMRGGSWGSSPDQDRSAFRQGVTASVRSGRIGFRVVREL